MTTRFTGGDNLTEKDGLKFYLHETFMLNELINGKGGYELHNAELAASGPSFGGFQYDIGSNSHGRDLLEKIAMNTKDEHGNRFLSDNDIENMRHHIYKSFGSMTKEDIHIYEHLKPKLDAALSSKAGIHIINEDYSKELDKKVNYVNNVIEHITNIENKKFLKNSICAQVNIADIRNQYGNVVNNKFHEFLNQSDKNNGVTPPKGHLVKVHGKLDMSDINNFRMATEYGIKHPEHAKNRANTIIEIINKNQNYDDKSHKPLSPLAESLRGQIENLCRTEVGKLGFKWDGGMDNTVYALTAEALKNGFKQATHLALNDGIIDLGDLSADKNLLAALDSNIAAQTPAPQSLKNIDLITQNQAQEESQKQTQQQTPQQTQQQIQTQSKAPHMFV